MQELLNQVVAIAALRKEATPGPWVQWVEHPSVYAGPAEENEPWTIRGVRVQVAECRIDQDFDMMSDFDQELGPYDGEGNAAFIAAVGGLDFDALATALKEKGVEFGRFSNDLENRLPDAFTNAIGLLEHLNREDVAQRLQTVAGGWFAELKKLRTSAVASLTDADEATLAKLNEDVLYNLTNGPVLEQSGVRWVSLKTATQVLGQLARAGVEARADLRAQLAEAQAFKTQVQEVLTTRRDEAHTRFMEDVEENGAEGPVDGAEASDEINKIAKALGLTLSVGEESK